ncbi:MAG: EamA family transporter RarD [Synergistaceae bacterium]|nr:EamA family transporter RarD [Synergistaceae bacterium]
MNHNIKGIAALFLSYFIWGAMPVYWKALEAISSFEILGHRVIWSVLFTFILILTDSNRISFITMLKEMKKDVFWLACGGFLISFNWGLYIWAVNHGRILETSLGYFINPLVSMFLGMMFFRERLNKIQAAALCLALIGVGSELLAVGSIPLLSIALALSFGLYGVLKKTVRVTPYLALFIETLTVSPIAFIFLMFLQKEGTASFPYDGLTNMLLAGTGIMTSIPLILFAYGAARVPLTTTGFVQYISPTLSFMLGVFVYNEPIQISRITTFIFIWTALAVYTADAVLKNRHNPDSLDA